MLDAELALRRARRPLVIGMGGGGDVVGALATAELGRIYDGWEPVLGGIAWERRPIDPVPGPRRAEEIVDAEPLAPGVLRAGPATRVGERDVYFAESRMAEFLGEPTILIDLTEGVSGGGHSVTISQWSCEGYNGALRSNGGGTSNTQVSIVLDTEPFGGGDPLYDVNDSGSLYGIVRVGDNGGRANRRPVVFNGAPNLKIVNDMMGPGLWTGSVTPGPPAVASSGTAVLNNSYRDCTVIIAANGATITAIAVNGTTLTGITSGQIRVPSGATITLTYTGGPPTWQWWRE